MKDKVLPIISIVIPTKNRYYYLIKLIKVIDSFNNKEFIEVVIQDNSDDNTNFLKFLNDNNFSFIKYFYNSRLLSVSENSDLAVRNSNSEYVTFIGDDDGVTNQLVDCACWMKKHDIDCVVPRGFRYRWNDNLTNGVLNGGTLSYKKPSYRMKEYCTKSVLEDLAKKGFISIENLPMLYHGIVKRSTLDKIWNICGTYFPGASPDIANGVSLCFVMDKFYVVEFPFVYSGASKHLGGGANKMKHRATDNFEGLSFLPKNIETIWDKRVPKVWAGCTIWCESAIEAIKAMKQERLLDIINFENLYIEFVCYHFYYRGYALALTNNKFILYVRSLMRYIYHCYNVAIKLVYFKLFKSFKIDGMYLKNGLNDIICANNFIESICDIKGKITIENKCAKGL